VALAPALLSLAACEAVPAARAARSAAVGPAAVFDLRAAKAAGDLEVVEEPVAKAPAEVVASSVRFMSTEWTAGGPRPIRLHGFLVRTRAAVAAGDRQPAVILAHGLGAQAELGTAIDVARNLDVVALAVSAPGLGQSEGRAVTFDDARALYDPGADVRRSWLYAYAYGLMRAVTLLERRAEVAPRGIVLSGVSMGALASFIANGVDDRIRGIMAVNGSGALADAVAGRSWLGPLLRLASDRPPDDPQVTGYFRALDALAFAGRQHGAVYMLVGAQDEFFPLPQVLRTFRELRAPAKSLALVADYDHEWYFGTGCPAACMPGAPATAPRPKPGDCPASCPAQCPPGAQWPYCGKYASYNNHREAIARWALLLRALVAQFASHPRRPFGPPPRPPLLERVGDEIRVRLARGGPAPRTVRVAISDNGGFTYGQVELTAGRDGVYRLSRPGLPRDALVFAEVEGPDGAVATSAPALPPGFRPRLRPFGPR
jgi:dienelactone hydrolase